MMVGVAERASVAERVAAVERLRTLLEAVVLVLVDDVDEVDVTAVAGQRNLLLEIDVAQPDIGKVLGRKGATIAALRTLMAAAGGREDLHVCVDVLDKRDKP